MAREADCYEYGVEIDVPVDVVIEILRANGWIVTAPDA